MTDLKSLVLYLSLHFLSQAQTAAAYRYIRPDGSDVRFSPLPFTGISSAPTATSMIHPTENKWQHHGEYSWYFPKETISKISGDHTGCSRPHATGGNIEIKYEYHSLFPPHPRETGAAYPSSSSSAINVGESTQVTNSTSKIMILPGSSAIYPSTSTRPSRVSASVSLADITKTSTEKVTLVPTPLSQTPLSQTPLSQTPPSQTSPSQTSPSQTPLSQTPIIQTSLIQTPRWVTKRSVPAASQPAPKSSSSTKSGPKPSLPATCASGKFYTVVSGDTCQKIALKQQVPVGRLISQNKLPSACNTLQIGQKLCLPQCKPYIVQPGDFCFKVTEKFDVELSDFYAANPEINSACTNLPLGGLVCIPEPASS